MTPRRNGTPELAITHVALDALTPAPYNPRALSPDAERKLKRGIERFGMVDPIIARREDGLVVGGHQRLRIARDLALATVPVVYVDGLSDDEAAALNVLLNNPGAQGEWDMAKLSDLVSTLDAGGFDATLTGFDGGRAGEAVDVVAGRREGRRARSIRRRRPSPSPSGARCTSWGGIGSCAETPRASGTWRYCSAAREPGLMVTDPPYGVEYRPAWRNEALEPAARREGSVQNDDRVDWSPAWLLFPGDVAYCWHAGRHASTVQASLEAAGFEIRAQVIWAKPRFVISRGHYHWQHEPCWYAVRKGATASWQGDRSQTTLWEIPLLDDADQKEHGTQKPTECMERPIRNHGGDVYDPFAGTGTTLIGAERQRRTAYLAEIDPGYCDVIRRRYAAFVGQPDLAP